VSGVRVAPPVQRDIEVMKKIKAYFIDTYNELVYKVTWPKWSELQSSAVVVMVASLIFAVVVFLMDFTFKEVLELVYGMFY
jgi:preprotein translocase subunit SecE